MNNVADSGDNSFQQPDNFDTSSNEIIEFPAFELYDGIDVDKVSGDVGCSDLEIPEGAACAVVQMG